MTYSLYSLVNIYLYVKKKILLMLMREYNYFIYRQRN